MPQTALTVPQVFLYMMITCFHLHSLSSLQLIYLMNCEYIESTEHIKRVENNFFFSVFECITCSDSRKKQNQDQNSFFHFPIIAITSKYKKNIGNKKPPPALIISTNNSNNIDSYNINNNNDKYNINNQYNISNGNTGSIWRSDSRNSSGSLQHQLQQKQ